MQILLATTNPHKLEEVRAVFDRAADAIDWQLLDAAQRQLGVELPEPIEDQETFEGNALLKARHYGRLSGMACLADDSGLEVDALGGRPGVHSARYSGTAGPRADVDLANNRKLLDELAWVPTAKRRARYVCCLCLYLPKERVDGSAPWHDPSRVEKQDGPWVVRGTLEGRILLPEEADDPQRPEAGRGVRGFGYDPLFVLPDGSPHAGLTTAQLSAEQKNALSHRGDASRKLAEVMRLSGLI